MSYKISYRSFGIALIGMGYCFHSQAVPRSMTFEQAVEKSTTLKSCPKRDFGSLESVYLSDSEGNLGGRQSGRPDYLVFQANGRTSMPVIGPLFTSPTNQQLQAL